MLWGCSKAGGRQDLFYLVVPRKVEEVTFASYLERPFLPFTIDAWLGVFAFLCGLSIVLWIVEICDMPSEERKGFSWSLREPWPQREASCFVFCGARSDLRLQSRVLYWN